MAHPEKTVRGRARLARDSQQWMLDYLIQETGRVFHFQGEGRGRLPRTVHSHDMISKHVGLQARRMEALAQAEAAAGHAETALDFYFQATVLYAGAQHVIVGVRGVDDTSRLELIGRDVIPLLASL